MLQMMIADDEPKIRRHIAESLNWSELGIEVVGFADNGVSALKIVGERTIDLCIVDISMPLLNGLDLIERMHEVSPQTLCIILSGYDEFDLIQRSLRLNVFDYLLKPLDGKALEQAVCRAVREIQNRAHSAYQRDAAMRLIQRRKKSLRQDFLRALVKETVAGDEIPTMCRLLEIPDQSYALYMIAYPDQAAGGTFQNYRLQLLLAQEALTDAVDEDAVVIADEFDSLIILSPDLDEREEIGREVLECANSVMEGMTGMLCCARIERLEEIGTLYESWHCQDDQEFSPLVREILAFIDANYPDELLQLNVLCDHFHFSPGYISRLFRRETGMRVVEYLNRTRVREAAKLLDNTAMGVYQVARQVGYASQQYFCTVFKKILGVPPTEYRKNNGD